jgi:hypothetical protein
VLCSGSEAFDADRRAWAAPLAFTFDGRQGTRAHYYGSANTASVSVATTATYCFPFLPR